MSDVSKQRELGKLSRLFMTLQGQEGKKSVQILWQWKGHGQHTRHSDGTNYTLGVMMHADREALRAETELQGNSTPDGRGSTLLWKKLLLFRGTEYFYFSYIQKLPFSKKLAIIPEFTCQLLKTKKKKKRQ